MPASRQADTGTRGLPQARTRLARAAVVGAARDEFLERGYGSSTIDAISARADVPAATVYRLFAGKLGILKAVLDIALAGDDEDFALSDRPNVRAVLDDPDPARRIAGFVAVAVSVNSRTSDVYRVLVSAAGSDPDAARLLDELTGQRRRGQGALAESLARAEALRPPLRRRDAADIVHALMSPEVYRMLVHDSGWSPARFQRWLSAALIEQLLGPAAETGQHRSASFTR